MARSTADHALAIVKAGVAAIPVVGGSIASLISDYVPSATQRALDMSIKLLEAKLIALGDRVDPENVDRDQFAELFKSAYLSIVRSQMEERLMAASGLIANMLLRSDDTAKLGYTELDHFARCLDNLSIGALQVLSHFVRRHTALPEHEKEPGLRISFESLRPAFQDMSAALLMGLVAELNAANLVHLAGSPPVRTEDYGNYPVELTELGRRFIAYVVELGE